MRNSLSKILTIAFLLLATSACAERRHDANLCAYDITNEVLRIDGPDVETLNPLIRTSAAVSDLSQFWGSYLFDWTDQDTWAPDLATEIPTVQNGGLSKDGRTVTFHLRRKVIWQDGVPFTADDIIFSWHAVLNPRNNVASRDGYDIIQSIDKIDKYTIRMHLSHPRADFEPFYSGTFSVLPRHLLSKYSDLNNVPYNNLPIGTGPFQVVSYSHGNVVELKANDHYWRGPPKLRVIYYRIVPDKNTAMVQLSTHEADLEHGILAAQYREAVDNKTLKVYATPYNSRLELMFNTSATPLRDRRVRQALAYGTDVAGILTRASLGLYVRSETNQTPWGWAYEPQTIHYDYDTQRAKGLLKQAGWNVSADGTRVRGGKRLQLLLAGPTGNQQASRVETIVQEEWKALGVDVVIKNSPSNLLFNSYAQGGILQSGHFDVAYAGWTNNPDPEDAFIITCSEIPPHGYNVYRYCNREVDRLEVMAGTHSDLAIRKAAYSRIQEILAQDKPFIVLWYYRSLDVASACLRGFKPAKAVNPFWNSWEWSI